MSWLKKNWLLIIISFCLILAIFLLYLTKELANEVDLIANLDIVVVDNNEITSGNENSEITNNESPESKIEDETELPVELTELESFPSTLDHSVAFVSQAPFGNWELPYQEACEEASLITVAHYFKNQPLTPEIMDVEIKKLVDWQKERFGLYSDTSIDEVAIMAGEYFNLKVKKITEVTIDIIKQELVSGRLIVAPFAGRELGNKYFTQPGPIYHMLVIKGYDRNEFITNDVGTRHGANFKYKYRTLINAIHDLPLTTEGVPYRPYDSSDLDEVKQATMLTGEQALLSLSL